MLKWCRAARPLPTKQTRDASFVKGHNETSLVLMGDRPSGMSRAAHNHMEELLNSGDTAPPAARGGCWHSDPQHLGLE